jgi:DNA-binding beta-propeller fold protein YncE
MHRTSKTVEITAIATIAVQPETNSRMKKNSFLLACFTLALLFTGIAVQPVHAGIVPAPRYAYAIEQGGNQIDIFTINLNTGALTPVANACNPQLLGGFGIVAPSRAQVDPTGSFLYVGDPGGNQVIGFAIQPNGCLVNIAPGPWPTAGTTPDALHISANGEFLYVADTCTPAGGAPQGCIEGFMINPNGTLAGFGFSPVGVTEGGLALDPVREYIYASDDSIGGAINGNQFNPLNGLMMGPWAPNAAKRNNPHRMALDPVGNGLVGPGATQFLLAQSDGANFLDCYTINTGAGGAAVWTGAAAAGPNAHSVALTPLGQFAYVTNNNLAGTVQAYSINNCAPLLDGAAVATGANPMGVTVDQTGRFVYVAASGAAQVWQYKINLNNGTLGKIGVGWVGTGPGPVDVATMP